ncbi:MAG: nickel pincer cofactor biosynthesis protein LarC, partial [Deltaproteobacteria bacterium]
GAHGDGAHGDHAHVHYADIRRRIAGALPPRVEELALDIFDRVARAEAKLHGTTVDAVAFHEVGAIDSIVDIVGAAAALAWLAPLSVTAGPVALGSGTVRCAHGLLPVPAPATLEIVREARAAVVDGGVARELCTPTGAAILAAVVQTWGAPPPRTVVAVGYGAGDADLPDRPNVLRAVVGRPREAARGDEVVCVEANVDDMNPELCEHAVEAMFAAGAVDVWWTPITMKKGRPALLLSALAPPDAVDRVVEAMWRETTTIGVRFHRVDRRVADREVVEVDTRFGRIPVKVARAGDAVVNAAPEYEVCRAAAHRAGAPLKEVFAAAVAAFDAMRYRAARDRNSR